MRKVECNLSLGDDFVLITSSVGECNVKMSGTTFSQQEIAAINAIAQTLKCLSSGRPIDQYFNPTITDEDETTIMKCEWMRSGRLSVRGISVDKKFRHAYTVNEALVRNRVFTCYKALLKRLPRKRRPMKVK